MQADLAATVRDIERLQAITDNLSKFIADSHGEDRKQYRTELLKFDVLFGHAVALRVRIEKAIEGAK